MVKKAHFVPKTYLKGFAYDDERKMVYAYSKKPGVFTTSIRDICTKKFIYRLDFAPDGYVDYIEDTLAHGIEPHYQKWLAEVEKKESLENSVIADLSIFIALQHLRIPNSLQYHNDQQSFAWKEIAKENLKELHDDSAREKLWREFKAERPEDYQKAIEQHPEWEDHLPKELIDNMINEDGVRLEIEPGKNNVLISMLDATLPLADLFIRRSWCFFFAPKGSSFITSDAPAFVAIPTPRGVIHFEYGGFGRHDAVIFFPMSKEVCAVIGGSDYNQKFTIATKRKVAEINRIIASRPGLTHLVSSSEKLVEKYSKYLSLPKIPL